MSDRLPVKTHNSEVQTLLDFPYLNTMRDILNNGIRHDDRTGTGTLSIYGVACRYDCRERIPVFSCRKVPWASAVKEMLWILLGSSNAKSLEDNGVNWWKSWGQQVTRDLGPVYGNVLRGWPHPMVDRFRTDQLRYVIDQLSKDKPSRRAVMSTWEADSVDEAYLPPCHGVTIQFRRGIFRQGVEYLDMTMYQRSADWILGVPINVAQYAFLLVAMANYLRVKPGFFFHMVGDAHVYLDHVDEARKILDRQVLPSPTVDLGGRNFIQEVMNLTREMPSDNGSCEEIIADFLMDLCQKPLPQLVDYNPWPGVGHLKASV